MKLGGIINRGLTLALTFILLWPTGCKKKSPEARGGQAPLINTNSLHGGQTLFIDTNNLQFITETEEKERNDYESNVRAITQRGDIERLESMAKDYRSNRASFDSGYEKLRAFYVAFGDYPKISNDQTYSNLINQLELWANARPNSITPRLALAEAYHGYAWMARGGGWASSVSDQAEQLMEARMEKGFAWLKQAQQLQVVAKDPAFYSIVLHSFLGANVDRQTYENVFNAGVRNAPDFTALYENKSYYLLPRWYGQEGEWLKFIRETSKRNDITNSAEIFARCAIFLRDLGYFYDEYTYDDNSWEELKSSFRALERDYPNSLEIKNIYCRMCASLYDYKEARDQIKQLNGRIDLSVWESKENFLHEVEWLSQDDATLESQRQSFKANPHKDN